MASLILPQVAVATSDVHFQASEAELGLTKWQNSSFGEIYVTWIIKVCDRQDKY